ncbi:MAG: flagellar hook-length control protein FliK [Lachnospiraceae bacterium]|nr:flagellar hook-length control protein FliK [Lachnospiraceae bacterium]
MIINNGLGYRQLNISPETTSQTPVNTGNSEGRSSSGSSGLTNLAGGDTLTGQIMSKTGNEVTISLGGDSVITAKLDIAAELPVGSAVTFTVKSSDSSGITLSPLMTNTDATSPVNTALLNAGLSIDSRNVEMVTTMMQRGMSVDKNELLQMNMSLAEIPDSEVNDAVMLKSLGITPSADNIEQFHAYQGYEHQVSGAVNEIMDMVPQTISQMIGEGDVSSAINMTRDILDIFTGQGAMEQMSDKALALSGMETPVNMILSGSELSELGQLLTQNGIDPGFTESMFNGEVSLNDVLFIIDDLVNSQAALRSEAAEGQGVDAGITRDPLLISQGDQTITGQINEMKMNTEGEMLSKAQAGPSGEVTVKGDEARTTDGTANVNAQNVTGQSSGSAGLDFLSALKSQNGSTETLDNAIHTAAEINKHAATDSILKMIGSKPFATLIQNAVSDQWKLNPGQVAEDKQVSDLYKRMTEQTTRLMNALNEHAKADTPIANSLNELGKNMNFMNELNNMFNYIQLPMKLSGNDTHGELYVYSNKKHMASNDGNVSALLHLDMDHLGPTDVYVTMNSAEHVNTHFYLPDDEALDLIEAHIDELNARIERHGYSCTSEISKREEMTNVMSEIIEDNKSVVPVSVSNFDARA